MASAVPERDVFFGAFNDFGPKKKKRNVIHSGAESNFILLSIDCVCECFEVIIPKLLSWQHIRYVNYITLNCFKEAFPYNYELLFLECLSNGSQRLLWEIKASYGTPCRPQ